MNLFFIAMLMLLINNCNAKAHEAKNALPQNELPYGLSKDGTKFFGKEVDAKVSFFLAIVFPRQGIEEARIEKTEIINALTNLDPRNIEKVVEYLYKLKKNVSDETISKIISAINNSKDNLKDIAQEMKIDESMIE
jgi:hypothetical protein